MKTKEQGRVSKTELKKVLHTLRKGNHAKELGRKELASPWMCSHSLNDRLILTQHMSYLPLSKVCNVNNNSPQW